MRVIHFEIKARSAAQECMEEIPGGMDAEFRDRVRQVDRYFRSQGDNLLGRE